MEKIVLWSHRNVSTAETNDFSATAKELQLFRTAAVLFICDSFDMPIFPGKFYTAFSKINMQEGVFFYESNLLEFSYFVVSFRTTSCAPPSTMETEETNVSFAFSRSSGRVSAPQLHMVERIFDKVTATPSANAPA